MHVVSWNVEDVRGYLRDDALPEILAALGSPDVLCLQELRIRPQDHEDVARLEGALPGYVCHHALAHDPRNVTFRGGRMYGVATFVRAASHAIQHPVEWDLEGRVAVSVLPALTVVNVYAPNGTDKPYLAPDGTVVGDRHTFKRAFNQQILELGRALSTPLLLIGDWNVSRAEIDTYPRLRTEEPHALARRLFNEVIIPGLDVVDIFRELHPEARKYTWFNRRARGRLDAARVDFALLSRSLLARATEADILEDPTLRRRSDHAPLVVKLGD